MKLKNKDMIVKEDDWKWDVLQENINNYYIYPFKCSNCKLDQEVYIKKGIRVKEIILHIPCSLCKCQPDTLSPNL